MLQEWCTKTSLNGILDLYEAKSQKWPFCFWLFVMICMFLLTFMFIAFNVATFINSPTVTNIATIADNNLTAPELLLCYMGGFNVQKLKSVGFSDDMIKAIQTGLTEADQGLNYSKLSIDFKSLLAVRNLSIEEFYATLSGFPCESIVKSRTLAGNGGKVDKCTGVSYFIGKMGQPCLLFKNNGNQIWPTPSSGGIRISVDGPNGSDPSSFGYLGLTHSFSLVVEKSVVVVTEQSVEVPLGYKTNILMSLTESIRLPKDKPCDPDTKFTTPNACFQRCYNTGILKSCNCTYPGFTTEQLDPNTTMCDVFHFHSECPLGLGRSGQEISACVRNCIPLCNEYLYSLTVSYLPLRDMDNTANISVAFSYQQYTKVNHFLHVQGLYYHYGSIFE